VDGTNDCTDQSGPTCWLIRKITDDPDLSSTLHTMFDAFFHILLIVAVAVIVRAIIHRVIDRVVSRTIAAPSLSSALPEKVPHRWRRRHADDIPEDTEGDARKISRLDTPERRRQRSAAVGSVLKNIVSVIVWTIAVIDILGELGVDLAPIIASAGIAGIAIGFGAQSVVKDFLAGILMILEDQYGVGDVVDLGVGNSIGTVESVGLRITRLRDVQGQVWHVRNGEILRVANKSQGWSRAVLDIPVAYGNDVNVAIDLIKEVADGLWHEPEYAGKILAEPEVLGVQDLGVSNVTIRLSVKTEPLAQWDVARQLRQRIKTSFDEAGLETPTTTSTTASATSPT